MKRWKLILIAIVIGATVLLGGMYWLGSRTQTYRAAVEIDAPPEAVFRYLTEPELISQWVHGVTEIRPLTEGGHRVGARSLVVVDDHDNRYEFTEEVLRSQPGRLLEISSQSRMLTAVNRWEIEPIAPQGSRLEVAMRADFKGFFRLFSFQMKSEAEQQLQADFERLKQLLESDDQPPPTIEATPPNAPPADPMERENETDNWMMT